MKSRFLVTCLLWVWVFAVSAPSILYIATEDASLIISLNASEEEPGEGEKKGSTEEFLVPEESMQFCLGYVFRDRSLPRTSTPKAPEFFGEIILPPPEAYPTS